MNATTPPALANSITQTELNLIGECLQASLENYADKMFASGQHYLIDVYQGKEAKGASRGETVDQGSGSLDQHVRLVHRMMSGVIQKQQKKLFPWTTFCFKPAAVAVEGANEQSSFLNLHAVRSISRKLWAMVRVHYSPKSKRPPELCCYVDRHIPALDVVLEPQIRIPLRNTVKLAADERGGVALPGALFSDNTNLGKPLQAHPQYVDISESNDEEIRCTLTNSSSEPVTLCEVVVCDYHEEEVDLDDDAELKLSGIEEGRVIQAGESVEIVFKGNGDHLSDLDALIVGYALGTSEDLDDDDDELMTEEELIIKLQGEDTRTCHISLMQGEAYEVLKRALLEPEQFISELGEDLAYKTFTQPDEFLSESRQGPSSLMLNSADLDGGSIGTLTLSIETSRNVEEFGSLLSSDQEVDSDLSSRHFTFGSHSAIPAQLIEKKKSKGRKSNAGDTQSLLLELIYLGKISLYNGLTTIDHSRARSFILNCVAAASLIRCLDARYLSDFTQDDELFF